MYLNILKKDLKRKKTMNIILLLFNILATMFVASGLNNVITVLNGTDYYFDKAGIGDFVIITMGDEVAGTAANVLENEPEVKSYKTESVVYGSENNIILDSGETAKTKGSSVFQSIDSAKLIYFNDRNEKIDFVPQGEVYISGNLMKNNALEAGDFIHIKHGDTEMDLRLAGKVKDALFGTDFMGNIRFLLNNEDMNKLLADENISAHYQGEITYVETDNLTALFAASGNIPGVAFADSRATLKMCYIMEMIVAFIVLILSVCLIIVSFVVLKFSISFTVAEEFREIGVMKAIGIKNSRIRCLYIVKYLILSVVGAVIGFFASIPFGNLLLGSVSENMVLGNDSSIFIYIISSVCVVAVILFFAYSCTGRVKKLSPLDAIRFGQTGERFKKKAAYRLEKSHARPSLYMALNDVLSNPMRFSSVIISFFICTVFVLMMVNTTETMNSSNLISTIATKSDLYLSDTGKAMEQMMSNKQAVTDYLEEKSEELTERGMPAVFSVAIYYKYNITFGGETFSLTCQQGLGIKASDYVYFEGTTPQNTNEIAITPMVSEKTGAKIGDTVAIDFGEEKTNCIVTAYFNTLNQRGNLIILNEAAPTDMKHISGIMPYQIDFTDNPSADEIENRKCRIKDFYDNAEVMNAAEYCAECIAVVDVMEAVQYLLLGITLIVVVLVTVLVERSFITDERSQIAILKAIGFKNGTIIKWHIYRFGLVALAAAVLAALASIPLTDLCISPIFGMMGTSKINYYIDIVKIFLIYPGIVFAATVITAWVTALFTRKIKSSEASNIE